MKIIGRTLAPVLAAGLLVAALGCGGDTQSPNEPEPAHSLAATQVLTFRLVTTGEDHSCGVTTDNRAYCWGHNFRGELGDGSRLTQTRPVAVAGGLRFAAISAGSEFTCGITTAQTAYCWGGNIEGQLGDGTRVDRSTPVAVKGKLLFRQIRPGGRHTCGTTTTNIGYCWGANDAGQLGIGFEISRWMTPKKVTGGIQFLRVIAGGQHTCALAVSRRAYCWGYGGQGALGDGRNTFERFTPTLVAGGLSYTQVVAGAYHSCGVTTGKRAYCWGVNVVGRLGDGTRTNRSVPTAVAGGHFFNGVSPAGQHTCGVASDQSTWCWGEAPVGGGLVPAQTPGGVRFTQLGGGIALHHVCALTATGRAYCWGSNRIGQLGDGTTTDRSTPTAVLGPS